MNTTHIISLPDCQDCQLDSTIAVMAYNTAMKIAATLTPESLEAMATLAISFELAAVMQHAAHEHFVPTEYGVAFRACAQQLLTAGGLDLATLVSIQPRNEK